MGHIKSLGLAAFAAALTMSTGLYADQWDKKTIIKIDAPVQIPTATLQPGTYTLKLLESASNRHIVTVWDQDGMHLVTTVIAIPNYRLQPTGKSAFSFWETPADQPQALRAWFYPGDNFGQEFAYPKWKAQQLAKVTHSEVPALAPEDEAKFGARQAEPEPAPAPSPAPAPPAETAVATPATPSPEVAAKPEPAPEPAPTPAPAPPPQQPAATATEPAAPGPAAMPPTAGIWAELVLVGFLATIAGFAFSGGGKRQQRRRSA